VYTSGLLKSHCLKHFNQFYSFVELIITKMNSKDIAETLITILQSLFLSPEYHH